MTVCVGVCKHSSEMAGHIFSLAVPGFTVDSGAIHFAGKVLDVTYVVNGGVGTRGRAVSTHANALTHPPPFEMSKAEPMQS